MPEPGSHQYDVMRTRRRAEYDDSGVPDQHADAAANAELQRDHPPVPDGAVELALYCEDPDAGGFVHWVAAGIPASTTGLAEGELPDGAVAGRNDDGGLGWSGPHPPVGDEPHKYLFRLLVLDQPLHLSEGVTAGQLRAAADGHELARGTLVGRFGR